MPVKSRYLDEVTQRVKQTMKLSLLFSLASNTLMLMLPLYSLQVLDRVLSSHSMETLVALTLIAVIIFIFLGVFSAIRSFIASRLGEWIDSKVAPDILASTVVRSSQHMDSVGSQNMRDLNSIKNFIMSAGFQTLLDAPWAPIFLLIIFLINPLLGMIAIGGGVVLFICALLTELSTKGPTEQSSVHNIRAMEISDTANRNAEAIESMGMMPAVVKQWEKENQASMFGQMMGMDRTNIISAVSKSLRMLIQVMIICAGGYLAMHNQISVGGMIASSILTGRALAPFEAAIGLWRTLVSARAAYDRLNLSLSRSPAVRGTMNMPTPKGSLSAEGIYFRPPGAERPTLVNVNFAINPGDSLGIIGPSAAGKSTLTKLIVGIWPPLSGKVRMDGVDVYHWSRDDFGKYVGYLPQDVDLFHGTIKDNIARMQPEASDDDVIEAAKMAGVHELILKFPEGYETDVRTGLATLSPGQKQRISLARALYGKPKLLVLDEPNSNLDGDGERSLVEAIKRAKNAGITTVVVAHKPSIVAVMDKVLMLRAGAVEAFGTREEVLPRYIQPASNAGQGQQPVAAAGAPAVTINKENL